jgi:hypothetical protein
MSDVIKNRITITFSENRQGEAGLTEHGVGRIKTPSYIIWLFPSGNIMFNPGKVVKTPYFKEPKDVLRHLQATLERLQKERKT